MAATILRSGTAVHITGQSPQKYRDLIEAGAVWHNTAQSLADAVGVIVLVLQDLFQVEEMLAGPDGILAGGFDDLLLIIASTSSPIEVRDLGRRLTQETEGRVRVIDAPVSGGSEGAHAGTLSIMVGGDKRDVNDA
jgi:2-hydroxy-3-oxopropionate reductase